MRFVYRIQAVLVLLVLVLAPSAAKSEARFALLIGNQSYNAKVGPLKNPHNDIVLIGSKLETLGFKVRSRTPTTGGSMSPSSGISKTFNRAERARSASSIIPVTARPIPIRGSII
jgi:hypothetical protein